MKTKATSKTSTDGKSRPSDEQAGEAALKWAVGSGTGDRVMREVEVEVRRIRRRRVRIVTGGITAMLAVGGIWFSASGPADNLAPTREVATHSMPAVLLPQTRTLADGSVVELRDGADIAVSFSDALRLVTLIRGEAHFLVTKDAERPFVVTAGEIEARAVGTAFSVHLGSSSVEVLVTEGQVAVERLAARDDPVRATGSPDRLAGASVPARSLAVVDAGNRIVVEVATPSLALPTIQPVSASELQEKFSWRMPRFEFSGTPLADVVTQFNQYNGAHIVLGNPALGRLQLSGVLRADNADSLLRLLEMEFGIKAERRGATDIVLRAP